MIQKCFYPETQGYTTAKYLLDSFALNKNKASFFFIFIELIFLGHLMN